MDGCPVEKRSIFMVIFSVQDAGSSTGVIFIYSTHYEALVEQERFNLFV